MSKTHMMCPFSKKACIECSIFRGRHLNLCSAGKSEGSCWGGSKTTGVRSSGGRDRFKIWKPPVLPWSGNWLTNIEDCFERREV